MPNNLLDTNHLGRLVDPRHPLRARLRTAIESGDVFYIILPIIAETVAGFSILPRAAQNWAEWQVLRPAFALSPIDEDDAVDAAELQVLLRRAGRQLATVDALIATIALRYDLILLTTDRDFTSVASLRLRIANNIILIDLSVLDFATCFFERFIPACGCPKASSSIKYILSQNCN